MSNLIEEYKKGQKGGSMGIPFGDGLEYLTFDTNGITRGKMFGVAGPEKAGKSTLTDYAFVIQPYLYALEHNLEINWVYYSFEIARVNKEFDFLAYFLHHDFGVTEITLRNGTTRGGKNTIPLTPGFLRGYLKDDNNELIPVSPQLFEAIQKTYERRIVPLFGEYDKNGIQIKKGLIDFREGRENPTGIYKDLLKMAASEGKLHKNKFGKYSSYVPNNPNMHKIVILDHARRVKLERGFNLKQTIDKTSEYFCVLRDLLNYTFVPILHTNRQLADIGRLNYLKGDIYPSSNDLKDSHNLAEDSDYIFTIFNPNDDQYNLNEHFGMKIRDSRGNLLYPNLRTIHLVTSRHGPFPMHYKVNMFGNLKKFEKLK